MINPCRSLRWPPVTRAAAMMGSALRIILGATGVLIWTLRLHRIVLGLQRRRPVVVLYHACEPRESDFTQGLRSSTTPAELERHLDFFAKHFRVVPLSRLHDGTAGARALVITFDDGYRSVHDQAFPLLRARGMPATVYLVPEVVGNESLVWVNELNAILRRYPDETLTAARSRLGLSASVTAETIVQVAVDRYDGEGTPALLAELRARASVDGAALAREAQLYLDWEQVAVMAAHGITFGNHTAGHPNLARVSDDEQRAAIERGRVAVSQRLGGCDSLAYPFGLSGARSAAIAMETGHTSVMEVGGTNTALDLSRVARVPASARTDAQLFAEIAIIEPVKTWLKRQLGRWSRRRHGFRSQLRSRDTASRIG